MTASAESWRGLTDQSTVVARLEESGVRVAPQVRAQLESLTARAVASAQRQHARPPEYAAALNEFVDGLEQFVQQSAGPDTKTLVLDERGFVAFLGKCHYWPFCSEERDPS